MCHALGMSETCSVSSNCLQAREDDVETCRKSAAPRRFDIRVLTPPSPPQVHSAGPVALPPWAQLVVAEEPSALQAARDYADTPYV